MPTKENNCRSNNIIFDLPSGAWLTSKEAAIYLNTTTAALAIRRCNGSGPVHGQYGSFIRYQKKALDDWMLGTKPNSSSSDVVTGKALA